MALTWIGTDFRATLVTITGTAVCGGRAASCFAQPETSALDVARKRTTGFLDHGQRQPIPMYKEQSFLTFLRIHRILAEAKEPCTIRRAPVVSRYRRGGQGRHVVPKVCVWNG